MKRYELSTTQWLSFPPGQPGSVEVTATDNVNGITWPLRSGARWKDRAPEYDNRKSAH